MRRGRSASLALAGSWLACGCYSYSLPVRDLPVPASMVEVTLNDRGRAALDDHIGTDALTVEGAVESVSDSGFVLKVQRVTTIDRHVARWAGESVSFQTVWVRQMRERHFSTGRTALLAASATAGAVAFVASGSLLGRVFGGSDGPGNPGGPTEH
jgi:hypothetical protein